MSNPDLAEGTSTKWRDADERSRIAVAAVWLLGVCIGILLGITLILIALPVTTEPPPRQPSERTPPGIRDTRSTHTRRTIRSKATTIPWTEETPEIAPDNPVCYKSTCINVATALRRQLNWVVPPCENFEEYVCGRYVGPTGNFLRDQSLYMLQAQAKRVARPPSVVLSPEDARHKASTLFQECTSRYGSPRQPYQDLRDFFREEKLDITRIPEGMSTQPEDLLALHIHLAFDYMLGSLLHVTPGPPDHITVSMDRAWFDRHRAYQEVDNILNFHMNNMARTLGVRLNAVSSQAILLVQNKAYAALTSHLESVFFYRQETPIILELEVGKLHFENMRPEAFADAVESNTPYTRFSRVDIDPMVVSLVGALWKALTPNELYEWTSWSVLDQCGRYVEAELNGVYESEEQFRMQCMRLVKHVMPEPIAAVNLLTIVRNYRDLVTSMTTAVGQYLAANASRWVRPVSVSVVVGFPTGRSTVKELNARYAGFEMPTPGNFFADWIKAARMRRQLMNSSDMYFDPSDNDVVVSQNGTVIVPAGVFAMPFAWVDSVPGVNLGGLGHMISKRLIQRLRTVNSRTPPECNEQGTSGAAEVFENLLAYEAARHVMEDILARNRSSALWLPMLLDLNPARQLFTVGCFKDCRQRGTGGHGSCEAAALRRLRSFEDAFGCEPTRPSCSIP